MDARLRRIRRFYDSDPEGYDRGMSSGLTDRLTRRGREEIGSLATGSVLEIGIGTGLSLPHYRSEVRVTGVDLSPGMLGLAQTRALDLGLKVDLACMDAQSLALPSDCFDTVLFSLCLCTVPHPEHAIAEARRVARPGAAMLFLEHVRSHLLPVHLLQAAITPLTRLMMNDDFDRPTEATIRAGGVEVESSSRWGLGVFTVIRGRNPQ